MERSNAKNRRTGFALWSIITILATFYPVSWKGGNTTAVYFDGAREAIEGKSPYQLNRPPENNYNYSPAFALLFAPLMVFGLKACIFIWATINILVYWWGVFCWLPYDKGGFGLFWRIFLAMEINGPIVHGQINPLLVGIVLIGLDAYRGQRWKSASAWLVTIANIKVIPALFLGPTVVRARGPFFRWAVLWTAALFFLPIPWFGWSGTISLHREWVHFLLREGAGGAHGGCADIRNLFTKMGAPALGRVIYSIAALITVVALFRPTKRAALQWAPWIALGFAALLMLSPKTEVPTYVILAPPCALLAYYLKEHGASRFEKGALILAAFLITFLHNDIWPKFIFRPDAFAARGDYKMVGTILVWLVACVELWRGREKIEETGIT